MSVGEPKSAPPVGNTASVTVSETEITFKPSTTGRLLSASSESPDPPPDAAPGSVNVPARPEEASQGRHLLNLPLNVSKRNDAIYTRIILIGTMAPFSKENTVLTKSLYE